MNKNRKKSFRTQDFLRNFQQKLLQKKFFLKGIVTLGVIIPSFCTYAFVQQDAPVQDAGSAMAPINSPNSSSSSQEANAYQSDTTSNTNTAQTAPDLSSLSTSQRIIRLEQLVNSFRSMNITQQMNDMQQQMASLRGQLEVETHQLQQLSDQVRQFYQDLDQRIKQKGPSSKTNVSPSISSTSSSPQSNIIKAKNTLSDTNAYQTAFTFLTSKQYAQALTAFQKYLKNSPRGQFAASAHYWMGEIYLIKKNNPKAALEFTAVINQFPKSDKSIQAKLKLALIHIDQGKKSKAKQELIAIQKSYPNSTSAKLAKLQLQQL